MNSYSLYAGLNDDTDKGWFWSRKDGTLTRTIVLLRNRASKRSVYCEYRELDQNFVKRYNHAHQDFDPKYSLPTNPARWHNVLVLSGWYRDALGRLRSQTNVDLEIVEPSLQSWAALRAACQHPDPGVRVATRLAVIGTWLGLVGLLFAILSIIHLSVCDGVIISAALLAVSLIICRGANRRA